MLTAVAQPLVRGYSGHLVASMEPVKTYYVHNAEYDDTPEEQGTYATEEAALAAGHAEGYIDVRAFKLPNDTYMWNVVIPLPSVDCQGEEKPEHTGIPKPEKWYVHGG